MKATLLVLSTLGVSACFLAQVENSPVLETETETKLWKLEIDGIGG